MSALLRLPFALLAALAMLLLWPGVASAEGGTEGVSPLTCPLDVPLPGCETQEPASQAPAGGPTDTDHQAPDELTGPSDAVPAFTGPQQLPEQEAPGTSSTGGTGGTEGQQTDQQESGQQTPAPSGDSAPDPAAVGECIATELEELLALLEESLGGAAEGLAAELEAGLADPTRLQDFLTGLPGLIESTVPELADELATELPAAIEGIVACLPIPTSPPAEEEPPAPAPVAQPTQQAVHYANCDDARAQGAAPVHAGQPGYGAHLDSDDDGIGCEEVMAVSHTPEQQPQLAYTGF